MTFRMLASGGAILVMVAFGSSAWAQVTGGHFSGFSSTPPRLSGAHTAGTSGSPTPGTIGAGSPVSGVDTSASGQPTLGTGATGVQNSPGYVSWPPPAPSQSGYQSVTPSYQSTIGTGNGLGGGGATQIAPIGAGNPAGGTGSSGATQGAGSGVPGSGAPQPSVMPTSECLFVPSNPLCAFGGGG